MTGFELAAKLSETRLRLKVLFVTGYGQSALGDRGVEQGTEVLHRPFSLQALAPKAREVIDGAGASR